MNFGQKQKSIVVVFNSATKQCAHFLCGLIGELANQNFPVNAVLIDTKEFNKRTPEQKTAAQKIIYIGGFSEANLASKNIMKWQFDKFGFRYGWIGNNAVILFDNTKMSPMMFFEMANFAKDKDEFKKYDLELIHLKRHGFFFDDVDKVIYEFNSDASERQIRETFRERKDITAITTSEKGHHSVFVDGNGAFVGIDSGPRISFTYESVNSTQMKEQQQKFAMLHFLVFGFNDFLGIKPNDFDSDNRIIKDHQGVTIYG